MPISWTEQFVIALRTMPLEAVEGFVKVYSEFFHKPLYERENMAVCSTCSQEMLTADGCTKNLTVKYKRPGRPGRLGDPEIMTTIEVKGKEPCHDCNAKPAHKHHPGCDMERCPKCKGQLISCRCPILA